MKSLWKPKNAKKAGKNLLAQRVYTSQLLGASHDLVLHSGGNTSVKARVKDFYGKMTDVALREGQRLGSRDHRQEWVLALPLWICC